MNIKKMKPIELANILDKTSGSYYTDEEGIKIEEEMWGLEGDIYIPLGKLSLPINWKVMEQGPNINSEIGLITVFNHEFFKNPGKFYTEEYGFRNELENMLDHVKKAISNEQIIFIETKGSESGYNLLMKKHIPSFLKLYNQTKGMPATTESLQCIKKAFIDYRG